jgi:hypothetical protein
MRAQYRSVPAALAGLGFVLGFRLPAGASALSDAARDLAPGAWVELQTKGYGPDLLNTGPAYNVLNYLDSGVWDPVAKEVRTVGGGHTECPGMIVYDESSNTWRNETPPFWIGGCPDGKHTIHGYSHNAVDPATGDHYYRGFYSTEIKRYVIGLDNSRSWADSTPLPGSADNLSIAGALVYFPEMRGLTFWGGGDIYRLQGGAWSQIKSGLAMGPFHNVAVYSEKHGVIYGGGGNSDEWEKGGGRDLHVLYPDGRTDELNGVPVDVRTREGLMTVDPVTGDLLLVGMDEVFRAYSPGCDPRIAPSCNAGNGAWRVLPDPPDPIRRKLFEYDDPNNPDPLAFLAAVKIPTYGVLMYLKRNGVYLYKHSSMGGIPPAQLPARPRRLRVR